MAFYLRTSQGSSSLLLQLVETTDLWRLEHCWEEDFRFELRDIKVTGDEVMQVGGEKRAELNNYGDGGYIQEGCNKKTRLFDLGVTLNLFGWILKAFTIDKLIRCLQ